jgi:hypothetical protein
MKALADWLVASRFRAIVGAVLLSVVAATPLFLYWCPGALIVLLALRKSSPLSETVAALVAALTLSWLLLSVGAGPVPAVLLAVALIVPPLLVGRLLARGGSLGLAFQFTTLAALAMLAVVHAMLSDPPGVWQPFVERLAADLDRVATMMSNSESGWHPRGEDLRETASAIVNWGVVAWILLLNTMAAGIVGLYAHGRQTGVARLGPEFRALSAGRTLAFTALAVALLSLIFRWQFAADVSRLFLGAFVFQGLAFAHSAREVLGFSSGWLAGMYVMLFLPIAAFFVQGILAVLGFLDNLLPLRLRLRAFAARHKGRAG